MPDYAITAPAVSHDYLFNRMAAVCHHGGAGTTHRAAKAGVPQFIMPVIVDQFFWGKQISSLKLGPQPVIPKKLTTQILADIFTDLTSNNNYRENARMLADSMLQDGGVNAVYELIINKMSKDEAA
jgi:sterol 3beta-glucosyltransferase